VDQITTTSLGPGGDDGLAAVLMCPDGVIAWTAAPGWALDTWFTRTALAARPNRPAHRRPDA
jgi:hypothetical protein